MKKRISVFCLLTFLISAAFLGCSMDLPEIDNSIDLVDSVIKSLNIPSEVSTNTNSIELPTSLANEKFKGIKITWKSDKPDVINNEGKVTHINDSTSVNVKLTAEISKNSVIKTKIFNVTVKNYYNIVLDAINYLSIPTTIKPTENYIDIPIKLDEEKFKNVILSWSTSHPEVVSNNGCVTHIDSTEATKSTLSVQLESGTDKATKDFDIIVENQPFDSDMSTLNQKVEAFNLNFDCINNDQNTIELPIKIYDSNISITWFTKSTDIINLQTNTVTHKDDVIKNTVSLIAFFKLNNAEIAKEFNIVVYNELSDDNFVKYLINMIHVPKEINESTNNFELKQDETFPIDQIFYQYISCSSLPDIITMNNYRLYVEHTPKAGIQNVKLTLTVTKGNASGKKDFFIKVYNPTMTPEEIEIEKDKSCVNAVFTDLTISQNVSKYQNEITLPTSLKGSKYEGVRITWSSNSDVIDANGKITHTKGKQDDQVTLTAVISKEQQSKTKEFTVTVKHPSSNESSPEEQIIQKAKENINAPVFANLDNITQETQLITTIPIDGVNVSVSWTTQNSKNISITDNKLTLSRDFIDVQGSVTAKLSYNNIHDSKDFEVVVPSILSIKRFGYDTNYQEVYIDNVDNKLKLKSFREERINVGCEYEINNINTNESTCDLKILQKMNGIGLWKQLEEYNSEIRTEWTNVSKYAQATEKELLKQNTQKVQEQNTQEEQGQKPAPSLDNYVLFWKSYNLLNSIFGNVEIDRAKAIDILIIDEQFENQFSPETDVKQFVLDHPDDEKVRNAVKNDLAAFKSMIAEEVGKSADNSWEEIVNAKIDEGLLPVDAQKYSYEITPGFISINLISNHNKK